MTFDEQFTTLGYIGGAILAAVAIVTGLWLASHLSWSERARSFRRLARLDDLIELLSLIFRR